MMMIYRWWDMGMWNVHAWGAKKSYRIEKGPNLMKSKHCGYLYI